MREPHGGTLVFFLFKTPTRHAGAIEGEGQAIARLESELGRKTFGAMRHGDPTDIPKAGRMTPVPEIDADDLAFGGFLRMRLHFEPVHPEGGNDKLIVALRIDGKMQIATVGAKARENIVLPIAVVSTPAGCKVFAAVKMPHIECPCPRLGFGIRQHPLGDEACGLEVGHYLMRRHQVGLAKLVEAVLHVIGRQ